MTLHCTHDGIECPHTDKCTDRCLRASAAPACYGVWVSWINIDNRLPPMGQPVLTIGSHEHPWICYRVADALDVYSWVAASDDSYLVGITHWMPLPEAP